MSAITFDDFERVDIRVGTVLTAIPFEGARKPAYQLTIDFGPELGVKKSSAQLTAHYDYQALPGQQVMAVCNFPPRQIGKFMSEVLVLCMPSDDNQPILMQPSKPVPNGGKLY
jgi:tRNA-binding protein